MALIPRIDKEPCEGWIKVVRSLIVVDFPAPFGPKKPKTSPLFTDIEILSTAFTDP